MLRILVLVALSVFCSACAAEAAPDCAYVAGDAAAPVALKRGVNLTNWWENNQNQALDEDEIKNLHTLGFDFVRLPLSSKWLMLDDKDDEAAQLARLRCDIVSLLKQNLSVVVDLHAPGRFQHDLAQKPDEAAARLAVLWQRLQPVLKDLPPDRVLLGLYNEPQIDTDDWWRIQGQLVQNLRAFFPRNSFVVMSGPDGGSWNLARMKPYDDKNIIYDFHFYEPIFFTHHGANWFPPDDPGRKTIHITYPAAADDSPDLSDPDVKAYVAAGWNRAKLVPYIDGIADWARRNNVKIACLEFGVYRPFVDVQSRANWLRDVRELFEKDGIPWALWEYRGGFGLTDDGGDTQKEIVKALGLNDSSAP